MGNSRGSNSNANSNANSKADETKKDETANSKAVESTEQAEPKNKYRVRAKHCTIPDSEGRSVTVKRGAVIELTDAQARNRVNLVDQIDVEEDVTARNGESESGE